MGNSFFKMKKQAKMLQDQLQSMQDEMKNTEETGIAGNGLVKITLSGDKKMKSIEIHPDCIDKDDIEGLQDLIISAYENVSSKLDDKQSFGGLPLPF